MTNGNSARGEHGGMLIIIDFNTGTLILIGRVRLPLVKQVFNVAFAECRVKIL